jgi:deoxyribonuclease-1
MKPWYWLIIGISITSVTSADQFQIPFFQDAEKLFWEQVYPDGGWTLYCGERFENPQNVVIDDIYAKEWAMQYLQCESLDQCRTQNAKFSRIESDLHNMYPALPTVAKARADYPFGPIAGEFRDFFECNFEYDARDQLAEPRSVAQGNIARAILYMHMEYDLPLDKEMLVRMLDWNRTDPPSKDEIRRNALIEKLQGTRNPFIDHPTQAEKLLARKKDNSPANRGGVLTNPALLPNFFAEFKWLDFDPYHDPAESRTTPPARH